MKTREFVHILEGVARASPTALHGFEGIRRTPIQARSRQKVEAILSAARDRMIAGGMGALSIDALAEQAGVAVGTIYQFFPNKEAVLNELARRTLAETEVWLADLDSEPVVSQPWRQRLDALTDRMAAAWRSDATAQVIWDPAWITPEMRRAAEAFDNRLVSIVLGILAAAEVSKARRQIMAALMVEAAASILDRWAREGAADRKAVTELRVLLTSYVTSAARL